MITDLERIGDQAADISELAVDLSNQEYIKNLEHIKQMAVETTDMVIKSINAYVASDEKAAKDVIEHDDVVDELFVTVKNELIALINEDVKNYHHDFNGGTDYSDDIDDNSQNINTIPESLKPLYGSIIND